jgi:predicted GNAT family N-acyltransferase
MTPNEELSEEFISKMLELAEDPDKESAHIEADYHLCQLLVKLGYEDVVKAYEKITKWYA